MWEKKVEVDEEKEEMLVRGQGFRVLLSRKELAIRIHAPCFPLHGKPDQALLL